MLGETHISARHEAISALAWLMDAGLDTPVEADARNWLTEPVPEITSLPAHQGITPAVCTPSSVAPSLDGIHTLEDLQSVISAFDHLSNPRDGRSPQLFCGPIAAPLMILAETPFGTENDESRLMSEMLSVLGVTLDVASQAFLMPWTTVGARRAKEGDLNMLAPFTYKAIELLKPVTILALGQRAAQLADPAAEPATLRGRWLSLGGRPAVASFAPSMLLRQPRLKADAWADLQLLMERL